MFQFEHFQLKVNIDAGEWLADCCFCFDISISFTDSGLGRNFLNAE